MNKNDYIVLLEETESAIRHSVMKLRTLEERRKMLHKLRDHVLFMSEVQALPQLVRESYHETVFTVFRYFHVNRQLGRKAHRFDAPVLDKLLDVISNFMYHDGV